MAITDAITGAIHRDKLRHIIHEQIQPRIELKRAAMINAAILESLDAVIISLNALTASNAFNEQQLNAAVQSIEEAQMEKINAIVAFDDKKVKQILRQIDVSKHSWTNEDYYFTDEDENTIRM
jgi:3-dehydroquinate synthase class II